jgi:membrane-bound metal-dependent hydrolase YbcI (DUF457 family)
MFALLLMSNVAHSLAGIAVIEIFCALAGTADGHVGLRFLLGALAGNFPDWDTFLLELPRKISGIDWSNPRFRHRGLTHDLSVCSLAGFGFAYLGAYIQIWAMDIWVVTGCVLAVQSHLLLDAIDNSKGFMLFGLVNTKLYRLPVRLTVEAVVPDSIIRFLTERRTFSRVMRAYVKSLATEMNTVGRLCLAIIILSQAIRWHGTSLVVSIPVGVFAFGQLYITMRRLTSFKPRRIKVLVADRKGSLAT